MAAMRPKQTRYVTKVAPLAALCALFGLTLAPCSSSTCKVQGYGTMKYLPMEGGFYGIQADSGARYRPVNLPGECAEEELRVRFCAQPLEGVVSFHMWGLPVKIVEIEPLEGKDRASRGASGRNQPVPGEK